MKHRAKWGQNKSCSKSYRFLDDGRVEIDSNVVERSIRPITLNRKNALFAGSDGGGEHWATIASLIETAKLNGVDPYAYTKLLSRVVPHTPAKAISERAQTSMLKSGNGADRRRGDGKLDLMLGAGA